MAGIGFVLRKLAGEDNLSGVIRAYFRSAVVAVGPWVMIVLSVGSLMALSSSVLSLDDLQGFLSVFMYNLCFSFILSGPINMMGARYVSDCLYAKDLDPIPGILVVAILAGGLITASLGSLFYIFYANMNPLLTVLSIINLTLLCQTWIAMSFLGLLKDYRAITFSWIIGTILIILCTHYFGTLYLTEGILFGMNVGISFLIASLVAHILAEFPYSFHKPQRLKFYFHYYYPLFWSGLFFFSSFWVDKVIMWFAPEGILHVNNLRTYPTYDGATFVSYLSIIPVMGLFIFNLETNFYEAYIHYVRSVENNHPFSGIEEAKQSVISNIIEDGRSFVVLQGAITFMVILFADQIFQVLGIDYLQLSIFRFGVLGAFFLALNAFMIVIFSYFDSMNNILKLSFCMLVTNTLFTLISLYLGFPYYGYGFCLAMIFSFIYGAIIFVQFLNNLTYHIFITNSVRRQTIRERYLTKEQQSKLE